MASVWAGLIAGFVATAVLSAMMLMKERARFMPEMDMIGMISVMMRTSRPVGWAVHFVVGTVVYGLAYAWIFAGIWSGTYWLSGLALGILGWLIAMLAMTPMAGKGVFGMEIGAMAPVMSLTMHAVFGVILGWLYGVLIS